MAVPEKTITIGLPLPNMLEYITDVSWNCRDCIDAMVSYMDDQGYEIIESKHRGVNVADNHNRAVLSMRGDWLLIIGSDHAFMPDYLEKLMKAANSPPYPRIIGGLMPHRVPPYAWVATKFSERRDRPFPIVPYLDFHPGAALSDGIMEVDTIGSGFTLYHRSVFDKVPYPYFCYGPYPEHTKDIEDLNAGNETDHRLADFLDRIANGGEKLPGDKEYLQLKAKQLRKMLAKNRSPVPWGPDYYMNIKAKGYGFKTYLHFGVRVTHYDFLPIDYVPYIQNTTSSMHEWWKVAMKSHSPTRESVQKIRKKTEKLKFLWGKQPEELIEDYEKSLEDKDASVEIDVPSVA